MDVAEGNGNGSVSYTVKELLARQDAKLDTILLQLNGKADDAIVRELKGRVASLEMMQAQQKGASNFQRWAAPILISLGVLVLGALTFLLRFVP